MAATLRYNGLTGNCSTVLEAQDLAEHLGFPKWRCICTECCPGCSMLSRGVETALRLHWRWPHACSVAPLFEFPSVSSCTGSPPCIHLIPYSYAAMPASLPFRGSNCTTTGQLCSVWILHMLLAAIMRETMFWSACHRRKCTCLRSVVESSSPRRPVSTHQRLRSSGSSQT